MDIVITYVNGMDPLWQKDYEQYTRTPINEKRFRDWGTLRYLFRGIAENMPFIRKVHLVVSQESQVPEWVNREAVNVVLHRDIIPAELLPTFNCNPIETHLHFIDDLDEEFLYFNDDLFPVKPCEATDFFRNGKGVVGMNYHLVVLDMFKQICRNSDALARKALGMKRKFYFIRPQHICTPMLKSECIGLYNTVKDELLASLTRVRSEKNINQYIFLDYMYLKGKLINERISAKHFSVGVATESQLRSFVENPSRKMTCINDVNVKEERYHTLRTALLAAFEKRFPTKSQYEL